jgi:DNA-binding NarL/FixJ family response regulator
MRILIVDSSIQIIERLEEMLSEAGSFPVMHSAICYEEAKKLCMENKYDAIILDIDMPYNGSVTLLKEIKKTGQRTCFIILFTRIGVYIKERYKALGAEFFFDKYYDFEKICNLLCAMPLINTSQDLDKRKSS